MTKVRWLELRTKLSIDDIAAKLADRAYTPELGDGFTIDQKRKDFLLGRFHERIHRVERIVDPFGNQETFERIEYRVHNFGVYDYGPGVEFVDPVRGSQTLVTRLLEIMDFDLAVSPIKADVYKWASGIQAVLKVAGVVDRVNAKNVQISGEALATIEIDAKVDAVAALKRFITFSDVSLQKLRVRLPATMGTFVVTDDGVIDVAGKEKVAIVEAAREVMITMTGPQGR